MRIGVIADLMPSAYSRRMIPNASLRWLPITKMLPVLFFFQNVRICGVNPVGAVIETERDLVRRGRPLKMR